MRSTDDIVKLTLYRLELATNKVSKKKAKKEMAALEAARQREIEEFVCPYQVQADCHFRPATWDDLEGVAAIYNQEVQQSYKVFDTQPVSIAQFRTLLKTCREQNQPFIVAVKGRYDPDNNLRRQVIGFCLLDTLQRGIAGSYEVTARPCGKISLVVHPDWRRKKVGTALLDILLICCSTFYIGKHGYKWVTNSDLTYAEPAYNPRKWYTLQMDVLVRSGKTKKEVEESDEYKWMLEFLEAKFNMQLIRHDEYFCHSPHMYLGASQRWLDRLVFEHRCRERNT